jgi:hypothetical protein
MVSAPTFKTYEVVLTATPNRSRNMKCQCTEYIKQFLYTLFMVLKTVHLRNMKCQCTQYIKQFLYTLLMVLKPVHLLRTLQTINSRRN